MVACNRLARAFHLEAVVRQLVKPNGAGGAAILFAVEEKDVRLHSGVRQEAAGGEREHGVDVEFLEQPLAHLGIGAAAEKNALGDDDSRASAQREIRHDVLDEENLGGA